MSTNREWKLHLKLDETLTPEGFGKFDSKVRIPVSGSILLTKEIREIIDCPEFQRLRGVRQLGPTMFVFPGATHTRFEHSLGVYELTLRYLEKVLTLREFQIQNPDLDKSIKLIIFSALLHDIGHYPYSHWIEDIGTLSNNIVLETHEKRAEKIIKRGSIYNALEKWKIDPNLIAKTIAPPSPHPKDDALIISFINSIIDTDKIDYLIRDSIHCGVNYGMGIDIQRIVDSLYINTNNNQLCMTQKGRSAYLSILSTRNIMYQEVYWHKTVRSCEAMFKTFFYEYVKEFSERDADGTMDHLNGLFNFSDDEFIASLYKSDISGKENLRKLIQPFAYAGRGAIYKPAYVYFDHTPCESQEEKNFFRKLLDEEMTFDKLIKLSKEMVKSLKPYINDIQALDIILETTPLKDSGKYTKEDLKIYNTVKLTYDPAPEVVEHLDKHLSITRQAFIFCNPDIYGDLKEKVINKKDILNSIFKKMN